MLTRNFHPRKSFGQNFLINPRIVEKIIRAADLKGDEFVVEVGPGFGILTEALLKNVGRVLAIEKDERLYMSLRAKRSNPIRQCTILRDCFAPLSGARNDKQNFILLHADALKIPPPKEPYVLVANIPYSITSPLLDHFIRDNPDRLPQRAILMVQKEVAQKICARPPHMNVLALHVQTFGIPKIIATVSKNNFRPRPKVDSAIIKIEFHIEWKKIRDLKKYFETIHKAFSHKRKMLRGVFNEKLLRKRGVDPEARAERLGIRDWQNLAMINDVS